MTDEITATAKPASAQYYAVKDDLRVTVPEVLVVAEDLTAVPPIAEVIYQPAVPEVLTSKRLDKRIYHREVENYVKNIEILECNLENLYSLVWLQFKAAMQDE